MLCKNIIASVINSLENCKGNQTRMSKVHLWCDETWTAPCLFVLLFIFSKLLLRSLLCPSEICVNSDSFGWHAVRCVYLASASCMLAPHLRLSRWPLASCITAEPRTSADPAKLLGQPSVGWAKPCSLKLSEAKVWLPGCQVARCAQLHMLSAEASLCGVKCPTQDWLTQCQLFLIFAWSHNSKVLWFLCAGVLWE